MLCELIPISFVDEVRTLPSDLPLLFNLVLRVRALLFIVQLRVG